MDLDGFHPNVKPFVAALEKLCKERLGKILRLSNLCSGNRTCQSYDRFALHLVSAETIVFSIYVIFTGKDVRQFDIAVPEDEAFLRHLVYRGQVCPLKAFDFQNYESLFDVVKITYTEWIKFNCARAEKHLRVNILTHLQEMGLIHHDFDVKKKESSFFFLVKLKIYADEEEPNTDVNEISVYCAFESTLNRIFEVNLWTLPKYRSLIEADLTEELPQFNGRSMDGIIDYLCKAKEILHQSLQNFTVMMPKRREFMANLIAFYGDQCVYCDCQSFSSAQVMLNDLEHFGIEAMVDLKINQSLHDIIFCAKFRMKDSDDDEDEFSLRWQNPNEGDNFKDVITNMEYTAMESIKKEVYKRIFKA